MLKYPLPRGNLRTFGTCGAGQGCKGPCDDSRDSQAQKFKYLTPSIYRRGQNITVKWGRQNHPGGFIRLAIARYQDSDNWGSFNEGVIKYTCYETNCGPDNPNNTNWGVLAGPGSQECSTVITIPDYLNDDMYTLQWMWYGGGVFYYQTNKSFGEYYSCTDFRVTGGSKTSSVKPAPVFKGGDIMYPHEDVCRYWGSNKVGDCNFGTRKPTPIPGNLLSNTLEPCMVGPPKKGKPFGF